MKLTEIKQALTAGEIRLTKSLGQNFLHDGNQLRRMAAAAELKPADQVLEIGPGLGPLTELLLARAGRVLAIEKDRRLFDFLQQRGSDARNLTLVHADALDYLETHATGWADWKVVANLPFSVASPILVQLARTDDCPKQMVVTLQWEAAQRVIAQAGHEAYGLLALLVQLRYEPRDLFKIPATCFFPAPDVDCACVHLVRRAESLLSASQSPSFIQIVKRSFSQRRKMMLKLLKADWPAERLGFAFEQLKLSPRIRAEEVSLEQFVQLARKLPASSRL